MLNFNFSPFGKWQYVEVQDKFMHNNTWQHWVASRLRHITD